MQMLYYFYVHFNGRHLTTYLIGIALNQNTILVVFIFLRNYLKNDKIIQLIAKVVKYNYFLLCFVGNKYYLSSILFVKK